MVANSIAAAERWLEQRTDLAGEQRHALSALAPLLLPDLRGADIRIVGIAGPPGTGKSTLAHMLAAALADQGGAALVLSLDDYYLPRRARERLAATEHPLFLQRGAPGTHDLPLLLSHLDHLRGGHAGTLTVPVFDKAGDDRLPEPRRLTPPSEPLAVLLEGWIVGVPPQSADALRNPASTFERERDPDGSWRRAVNDHLANYASAIAGRLDRRWLLRAPGWDTVVDWRWQQEQGLPPERRLLADRAAVTRFLDPFRRLCDHMQDGRNPWAHRIIDFDRRHCPSLLPCP